MAQPPLPAGGAQVTVADRLPADATALVGAPGSVAEGPLPKKSLIGWALASFVVSDVRPQAASTVLSRE